MVHTSRRYRTGLALAATALVAAACSEYRFEPVSEIGTAPPTLVFALQNSDAQAQPLYIQNTALTARLKLYDVGFYGNGVAGFDKKLYPRNGTAEFTRYPANGGFSLEGYGFFPRAPKADGTPDPEAPEENLFFRLEREFNFQYTALDLALTFGDDGRERSARNGKSNVPNPIVKPENAVRYCAAGAADAYKWVACAADEDCTCADSETLYAEVQPGKPIAVGGALLGLNVCDQLALSERIRAADGQEGRVSQRLFADRLATHQALFSDLGTYTSRARIRVGGEPGARIVDNPASLKLGQPAFIRDAIRNTGVNPFVLLNNATPTNTVDDQVVIDRAAAVALCGSVNEAGVYQPNPDRLSVDLNRVRLRTLPLLIRYRFEPRLPNGDERAALSLPALAPGASAFSQKRFRISLNSNDLVRPVRDIDVVLLANIGGPPVPVIEKNLNDVKPLDERIVSGLPSFSPENRTPLTYFWQREFAPPRATDFACIQPNGDFRRPEDNVFGRYTEHATPRCYFPVPGTYRISLKVKDNKGVESTDNAEAEKRIAVIDINVVPRNAVFVQLSWDKGAPADKPNESMDLDLYLVRFRTGGTMGVGLPSAASVALPVPRVPSTCSSNNDCAAGAFTCASNRCDLSCTDDAKCKTGHPSWRCDNGTCKNSTNPAGGAIWPCTAASDCTFGSTNGFCVPSRLSNGILDPNGPKICTRFSYEAINDTCSTNFSTPDWGVEGDPNDNPSLDKDDVNGFGPEQITIRNPPDGKFRAIVRFFADTAQVVSFNDPVRAFVRVFIRGEQCFGGDIEMPLTNEDGNGAALNMYWKVADITWQNPAESNTCAARVTRVPLNPTDADQVTATGSIGNQCLGPQPAQCAFVNPFNVSLPGVFNPADADATRRRSIWCDKAGDPECPAP